MPSAVGEVLRAGLIAVEERAFEIGPQADRAAPLRRRAHEAGIGTPRGEQALDVIARHQHVRIGDGDEGMRRGAPSLDAIVELGIGADAIVADEKLRRYRRMLGDELAHHRHHRIALGGDAEDQLVFGVVELEGRAQRLLDEIVEAADRPHDGDRRRVGRRREGRSRTAAKDRDDDADDVKQGGDGAERCGCDNRSCHANRNMPIR